MCRSKWALVPLLLVIGMDFWLTLAGQSEVYWQGMYHYCNEASFIGKTLLKAGPGYFITACIFWVFAVCLIIGRMRESLDGAFCMGVLLGHAWGSSTWLHWFVGMSFGLELDDEDMWYIHVAYIVFISLICGIFFRSEAKKAKPAEPSL